MFLGKCGYYVFGKIWVLYFEKNVPFPQSWDLGKFFEIEVGGGG